MKVSVHLVSTSGTCIWAGALPAFWTPRARFVVARCAVGVEVLVVKPGPVEEIIAVVLPLHISVQALLMRRRVDMHQPLQLRVASRSLMSADA